MTDKTGYKIWRKDKSGWELAFDTVYSTREKVDERIAELNAVYHQQVQLGELEFLPYLENIKLARNGSVIDDALPTNKPIRRSKYGATGMGARRKGKKRR